MSEIVNKINQIPNLRHLAGCANRQIEDAQRALNLIFPSEFIDYVKEFGVIGFYATEWTGLNVEGYLNTVQATNMEKEVNAAFPAGCFVLEDLGIDARKAICNQKGQVHILQYEKTELLCESISEYLDICIARKECFK